MRLTSHAVSFRVLLTLLVALAGCAGQDGDVDPASLDDGVAIDPAKADDFLSVTAKEFIVEGRTTVTIESALANAPADQKMARVKRLISLKQLAISWFLNEYIINKHDAANQEYGGFSAMAKAASYEEMNIRAESATSYSFDFRQIIAGQNDLLSAIPTTTGTGGTRQFTLTIGLPSNAEMERLELNHEWYRQSPWNEFNPATVAASQKTDLVLTIKPEREQKDAYIDYNRLFADGKLTIDIHLGWDYAAALHVKHARTLFTELKDRLRFRAPATSFPRMTRTNNTFTRTIRSNGRDVQVEVRLFYPIAGSDNDPDTAAGGRVLEQDMRNSLRTADVILFSGHSGPFYGFALANWRMTEEGDLDDSELASVEMPSDRYQIVMANGCDTYMIGGAFFSNPAKRGGVNLDVITTTSFSNEGTAETTKSMLWKLLEVDPQGRHRPRTMKALLEELDASVGWAFDTMFGIHGINDNPRRHPYANEARLCQSCRTSNDCGDNGNMCLKIGTVKRCAFACTDDSGCPDGYACRPVASAALREIYANACVPRDNVCR